MASQRYGRTVVAHGKQLIRRSSRHHILHASSIQILFPCSYTSQDPILHALVRSYSTTNSTNDSIHDTVSNSTVAWGSTGTLTFVRNHLRRFPRNYEVKEIAINAGLNPSEWQVAVTAFSESFLNSPELYFTSTNDDLGKSLEMDKFVADLNNPEVTQKAILFYPYFLQFAKQENYIIPQETYGKITPSNILRDITDLRLPHEMYPLAAKMQRKIIYHEGPTNSGKTYEALERLKQAAETSDSDTVGIYCGPLRLLALEVYEKMNMDGYYTSLITGQEKKIVPMAQFLSCTVEMAPIYTEYEVAVIDEIQLIGDPQRGWAWTKALFGVPAKEVHVCGSSEALDLVRKFAQVTGDEFEHRVYERRTPLSISSTAIHHYGNVEPGDCVIAFSRRELFNIKRDIETLTGLQCCTIYGQLPPETRTEQARLFNEPNNNYDVLVASDAVGMGLNLQIKRIVFSTVKKFTGKPTKSIAEDDDEEIDDKADKDEKDDSSNRRVVSAMSVVDLPSSLVKQIAGRAGRSGSRFPTGTATALNAKDLAYVRDSYHEKPQPLKSAGLFPSSENMVEFAKQFPSITDLGALLDKYVLLARMDGDFFMCNHLDMKEVAALISGVKSLDLKDRFTFCMAPLNLRTHLAKKVFLDYVNAHAEGKTCPLDIYLPRRAPQTPEALRDVEIKAQIIDLYLWLSLRFETTFVEGEEALALKQHALTLVNTGLANTTVAKARKRPYGKHLKNKHRKTAEIITDSHITNEVQNSNGAYRKHYPMRKLKKEMQLNIPAKKKVNSASKPSNESPKIVNIPVQNDKVYHQHKEIGGSNEVNEMSFTQRLWKRWIE